MYRSILLPLDGSDLSASALPLALAIARGTGATLHLAHVHVPLSLSIYSAELPLFDAMRDQRQIEQECAYLDSVAGRLRAETDIQVEAALLDSLVAESVSNQIASHALGIEADMVIMTTHGRGGIARFWLGSVADELVRRLPMPLLLLRPERGAIPIDQTLRHILVPLDGSAEAEAILDHVLVLGRAMRSDITLLRVIEPAMITRRFPIDPSVRELDNNLLDQLRLNAQIYLERAADHLAAESLAVCVKVIVASQAAIAIMDEVSCDQIDLIAMATHGRHGLARLLIGSVADKVLRGATAPVLLYRAHASKERS